MNGQMIMKGQITMNGQIMNEWPDWEMSER